MRKTNKYMQPQLFTKKKIILITNYAKSIIDFKLPLMVCLKNKGLNVIVCAPEFDEDVLLKLSEEGIVFLKIKMDRVGINPLVDFKTFFDLYYLFKKEKPDFVLNYTIKPIIYSSLAAYYAKVSFIGSMLTGFGSIFLGSNFKTRMLRLFVKPLFRLALKYNTKIFALNPDIVKTFAKQKILRPEKTILINGEGVDIDYYNFALLPTTDSPIFLIISRLIRDKGIYEYVEAAKIIKKKYPKVRFQAIGGLDVNPTALTKKELDNLITDGVVEYLGELNDVRPWISKASVYVLPSYAEGMPRSTLEAMSMGRPVITTDVPGCRETVVDGVNGYLVPVKNVEKLVDAMEKFILYTELIAKMGVESRGIVEDKYDLRKVNKVILGAMGIN